MIKISEGWSYEDEAMTIKKNLLTRTYLVGAKTVNGSYSVEEIATLFGIEEDAVEKFIANHEMMTPNYSHIEYLRKIA